MEQLFSSEMLAKNNEEKIAYFENCRVSHPKLSDSYTKLSRAINHAKPGQIIIFLGPAGVGKTTTLDRLRNNFLKDFDTELNPGRVPLVMIEAVKDKRDYNWKDHHQRILSALYDPIPDRKVDYQNWETLPSEISDILQRNNTPEAAYRRALEKALIHRRPKAVLIDEAQHIAATRTGIKTLDQLNIIKSLANMSKTVHVLCGSYELSPFLNLSGQLAWRSSEVHFQRYRSNSKDLAAFEEVVINLQLHIPVVNVPPLHQHWEFLYERSIGCVGILHRWLARSLKIALDERLDTLPLEVLRETQLPLAKCETLLEESLNGESSVEENQNDYEKFLHNLGLKKPESNGDAVKSSKPNKTQRAVGERKPGRDPVGNLTAA